MNLLQAWCMLALPRLLLLTAVYTSSAMGSGLPLASLPGERNSASLPESVDLSVRDPAPHQDGGGLSPRHPVAISLPPTGFVSSSRFKAAFVRSIILLLASILLRKRATWFLFVYCVPIYELVHASMFGTFVLVHERRCCFFNASQ